VHPLAKPRHESWISPDQQVAFDAAGADATRVDERERERRPYM
jgi:hypothetical protein